MLKDKTVVGLVFIERFDNVITITPGLRAFGVEFITIRFAEAHDIEPVLRLAFTITRRRQQSSHDLFIGIRRIVREEGCNLGRRWRQAGQIERHAPQQRAFIGWRRRRETFLFQRGENKSIYRIAHPGSVADLRNGVTHRLFEGPVIALRVGDLFVFHELQSERFVFRCWFRRGGIRPGCACINPLFEQVNFVITERAAEWHALLHFAAHESDHQAQVAAPGNHCHPARTASECAFAGTQVEAGHFFRAVTRQAFCFDDHKSLLHQLLVGVLRAGEGWSGRDAEQQQAETKGEQFESNSSCHDKTSDDVESVSNARRTLRDQGERQDRQHDCCPGSVKQSCK